MITATQQKTAQGLSVRIKCDDNNNDDGDNIDEFSVMVLRVGLFGPRRAISLNSNVIIISKSSLQRQLVIDLPSWVNNMELRTAAIHGSVARYFS